jgi:hypothetical protein
MVESSDGRTLNYSLNDISGRLLLSGHLEGSMLDISVLKPGIYLLNIENKTIYKIMKQ